MNWELEVDGLKHYPHFDAEIGLKKARKLINDPKQVERNPFYPFIMYHKQWQPYRSVSPRPPKKDREIRYAARKDAYIFAKYRHDLAARYDPVLAKLGLDESVIAYRRVRAANGSGKCNIDFALEVFEHIERLGNCCFIALDISKFFENIDHALLEKAWCDLIGTTALPSDHLAVFKAVTNYCYVEKEELYKRLGFLKANRAGGGAISLHSVGYSEIPKKLCDNKRFRQLVEENRIATVKFIHRNKNSYGIPQGAPISDFLANLYLLEFDKWCSALANVHGGIYRRYSDDILFVVPVTLGTALQIEKDAIAKISTYGATLKIKPEKSQIVEFFKTERGLSFQHRKGNQGKNGAEYLGFRFDGKHIYLRDGTVSNLYRKIALSAKAHCFNLVKRFPKRNKAFLKSQLNLDMFLASFGKAKDFDPSASETWTFLTYAKRAEFLFGRKGRPLMRQLRHMRSFADKRLTAAFLYAARGII